MVSFLSVFIGSHFDFDRRKFFKHKNDLKSFVPLEPDKV